MVSLISTVRVFNSFSGIGQRGGFEWGPTLQWQHAELVTALRNCKDPVGPDCQGALHSAGKLVLALVHNFPNLGRHNPSGNILLAAEQSYLLKICRQSPGKEDKRKVMHAVSID